MALIWSKMSTGLPVEIRSAQVTAHAHCSMPCARVSSLATRTLTGSLLEKWQCRAKKSSAQQC